MVVTIYIGVEYADVENIVDFTHRPLPSCTSIESRSSQEHLRRSTVKVNLDYDDDKENLDFDFHVSYFSFCYAAQSSALSPRKGKYKFI